MRQHLLFGALGEARTGRLDKKAAPGGPLMIACPRHSLGRDTGVIMMLTIRGCHDRQSCQAPSTLLQPLHAYAARARHTDARVGTPVSRCCQTLQDFGREHAAEGPLRASVALPQALTGPGRRQKPTSLACKYLAVLQKSGLLVIALHCLLRQRAV